MIGRLPLWATLLPLGIGILVWALVWRSHEAEFEGDLAQILPAGTRVDAGGFPYRLEARLTDIRLAHADSALSLSLAADEAAINRVPWQRDRQVISLGQSDARAAIGSLAGASVRVSAPEAQASLRLDGPRIARLSAVWQQPKIMAGLFAAPIGATSFEAHLRETPAKAGGAQGNSPRLPTQVQLVLGGTGVRFGKGDPVALALDSEFTAAAPIKSVAAWALDGTVEIRNATLKDGTGEVARMAATLVPDGKGALRIAGTVETVCPATVRAAIAGVAPPREMRARKPETVAFAGLLPGGVMAAARDPAKPPPPVRGQEPPCPRLG